MKIISLMLGSFLIAGSAFSFDVLFINCKNELNKQIIDIVLDMEAGEKNTFVFSDKGRTTGFQISHIEMETDAMEVDGAVLEIYGFNQEIEDSTRLSLMAVNELSGESEGVIVFGSQEEVKHELACTVDF